MKRLHKITGKTRIFGIFGCPVRHSLSPIMQNAALESMGLDGCYLPFEVHPNDLSPAVSALLPLGVQGINVTVPHKETVIPFLHELSPHAERVGAVNTIEMKNGRLIGHNTDGYGFARSLEESGLSLRGRRVVLLGAGGSAKAVAFQMGEEGVAALTVANRSLHRAEVLADFLATHFPGIRFHVCGLVPEDLRREIGDAEVVVHTTSVGLRPDDPLLIPMETVASSHWVLDLIYNPPETPLLGEARRRGARTLNGLGMLLHQGVRSFEIWTGKTPPVDVMRGALNEAMGHHGH